MGEIAVALSAAMRKAAVAGTDVARRRAGQFGNLANLIRGSDRVMRAADGRALIGFGPAPSTPGVGAHGAGAPLLRSYWLRRVAISDGHAMRKPIGVILGDFEWCVESRVRFRAPDSSLFGHVQIGVREDPVEFLTRWEAGRVRRLPRARWVPSPYFQSAVRQQRPPVTLGVHHGDDVFRVMVLDDPSPARFGVMLPENRFETLDINAAELVELLQRDRIFQGALDANPGSDIWLLACDAGRNAQVVADAFGVTTHAPAGLAIVQTSEVLVQAAKGSTELPYVVDNRLLRDMEASLRDAPLDMQLVASKGGWNVTAVLMQPDAATGTFTDPVVTCHPNR